MKNPNITFNIQQNKKVRSYKIKNQNRCKNKLRFWNQIYLHALRLTVVLMFDPMPFHTNFDFDLIKFLVWIYKV